MGRTPEGACVLSFCSEVEVTLFGGEAVLRVISFKTAAARAETSVRTLQRQAKLDPAFPQEVHVSRNRVGLFEHQWNDYLRTRQARA